MTSRILSFILLILMGILAYLWFFPRIPAGRIMVTQTYLDSLADIANQPPRIEIKIDTFWNDTTIYIEKEPPTPTDQGMAYTYTDSVKTPELSFWIWDRISKYGIIENRRTAYRLHVPFRITERTTIFQPVPKPYPIYVERSSQQNPRIRYYGMIGWGNIKGVDGGFIYKDRIIGGAQAGILGNEAVFQAKLGLVF